MPNSIPPENRFHRLLRPRPALSMEERERIRPQIGPLTFLKIFVLDMIYRGRSQHTEPSYIIIFMSVFFSLYMNDLYTIPMLTNSSNFSIINTAYIDLQDNWGCLPTSFE